ncbi:uncharacterized protein MKZ38_002732 [Zalerion maritima]|uniref:mRNA 3'-end-processing protein RNA14 n=1 Tax=Zalerion maritima TaxID=339359 RepID=A0AAD5RNM3_9PEZI|nr:uncharacterized protein MKZ38_002732 [Zalerion maritima]
MASEMSSDTPTLPSFGEAEDWNTGGGGGEIEDTQPSLSEHSEHQVQEEPYSVDKAIVVPGDIASDDGAEDGAEYDPESIESMDTHHVISPPAPAPAPLGLSKMSKTVSGFVVDSSDDEEGEDEDEDELSSAPIQGAPSGAPQEIVPHSRSPVQASHKAGSAVPVETEHAELAASSSSSSDEVPSGSAAFGGQAPPPMPTFQPDMVAVLEQRVKNDPRGDMDAWLDLMKEHRYRSRIDELRNVYTRFLETFPHAADIWVESLTMELNMDNFGGAEDIFRRCLMTVPSVKLWTTYLDYIRRRHDLNDATGDARRTITHAYEFVLDNIGVDKDSGAVWLDYLQFIRNGPGQIGGTSWQDQQKMDQLRKAYQRAICVPISNLNIIWKEYDGLEMNLNKMTGRKFLQEKSPAYMTARSANTSLENTIRGLVRSTLPRLPPAPGFEGDKEYQEQVELWTKWISWEKDDPLNIRTEDPKTYQQRILHVFKQALMALRFWPELWVDAAEWCFENEIVKDGKEIGMEFLHEGISANPENVLLALKLGDRIEMTYLVGEGEEAKVAYSKAIREPYDKVLNHLYGMIDTLKERENAEIVKIGNSLESGMFPLPPPKVDDDDDDPELAERAKEEARKERIRMVQKGFSVQTDLLKRTITFVWIALFRAMRRIQGKGSTKVGVALPGARGLFQEARSRGRLTSEIYAAVAQVEWNVYQDPSATKIFDRGSKLFPNDELYLIEYLKHLHARHDTTNARVVFETCANKLTQNPDLVHKAKPLYAYFHKYESFYGELSQVAKLERRMTELFPADPKLKHFSARFSAGDGFGIGNFSPVNARLIISPSAQMKPKLIMPSIEAPQSIRSVSRPMENSPRPQFFQAVNSPKRPLPVDDEEPSRPYKMARGESPLKGAAGRRLDQQRRQGGTSTVGVQPTPIARDISFIITQIPGAEVYHGNRYAIDGAIRLLQSTHVPTFNEYRAQNQSRDQGPRQLPSHNRQASTEHPQYPYNRNSPAPPGRPLSPYGRPGMAPISSAASTYRNSPLRPGSTGSFEPSSGFPPPTLGAYPPPPPADSGTGWPPAGGPYAQPPASSGYPPHPQQYPPRYNPY